MNNRALPSILFSAATKENHLRQQSPHADISIVIIHANRTFCDSISLLLNTSKGYFCTGSFTESTDLLDKIRAAQPDIVLLDVNLPNMCCITAVRMIRADFPDIRILMLTGFHDDELVFKAICTGALGYILEDLALQSMMEVIHELQQGFLPMSPAMLRRVIEFVHQRNAPVSNNLFGLTLRETEVMNLMIDGASYKMIANKMGISYDTVHNHIKRIYCKLEVNSMSEAVAKVMKSQKNQVT